MPPRPRSAGRSRPKRSFWRVLLRGTELILFFGVVTGGAYALYDYARTSERLRVKTIAISGAAVIDERDIIAETGITNVDNLLFLDIDAIQEQVQDMPYVKHCRVERDFPDRVVVTVVERTAVATLVVDSRLYLIDKDGVVLRELTPHEAPYGPLITQVQGIGYVSLGSRLDHKSLEAALAVWDGFSSTRMAQDVVVSEIAAPHEDHIRMYCDELPFEIRWGRNDFVNEAYRLDLIWEKTNHDPPCSEYLDLRFGDQPVCK